MSCEINSSAWYKSKLQTLMLADEVIYAADLPQFAPTEYEIDGTET